MCCKFLRWNRRVLPPTPTPQSNQATILLASQALEVLEGSSQQLIGDRNCWVVEGKPGAVNGIQACLPHIRVWDLLSLGIA